MGLMKEHRYPLRVVLLWLLLVFLNGISERGAVGAMLHTVDQAAVIWLAGWMMLRLHHWSAVRRFRHDVEQDLDELGRGRRG